jgi:cell division protease FtsH
VLFFDEFQALFRRRSDDNDALQGVTSQLLLELSRQATSADVVIIAATNRPEAIDPALLRPGTP